MSDSLGKLPEDVQKLLNDNEWRLAKLRRSLFEELVDRAHTWNIKVVALNAPINICNGQAHRVVEVVIERGKLDEWLEYVKSPLKVYTVHTNAVGSLLLKVCECTGPPSALESLARTTLR